MKTKTSNVIVFLLIGLLSFTNCKKDNNSPSGSGSGGGSGGGGTPTPGDVTFWHNSSHTYSKTIVDISQYSANITLIYSSSNPICGSIGCANFTLNSGVYTYEAKNDGLWGKTWSGTAVVDAGGCTLVVLE